MSDYSKWTVKALRENAKKRNIKIPSGSRKADIVKLLKDTPMALEPEVVYDPLTQRRQKLLKKILLFCKKEGVKKISNYFKSRNPSESLKRSLDRFDLHSPTNNEIRICLKFYQETQRYNKGDKLLINQMITQPKYIDPKYVNPRKSEFDQIEIKSVVHGASINTNNPKKLNKAMRKEDVA